MKHDLTKLSSRQKQIFKLLADGLDTEAISNHLFLSNRTVVAHHQGIIDLFNLEDEADLIRVAKSVYL